MVSTTVCERSRPTTREALIGAAVLVGGSLLLTGAGLAAEGRGWPEAAEALTSVAFPIAMMLSMPFWLMRGQRRTVKAVVVGGTTACLAVIGVVAALW
jgi:hypothetical protein